MNLSIHGCKMHEWLLVWVLVHAGTYAGVLHPQYRACVPLLAHGCVISPCPAMFVPVCVSEHHAVANAGCHLFVLCLQRTISCQEPAQRSGGRRHEGVEERIKKRIRRMRKHLFYVALGELKLKVTFAKIICFYVDLITNVHGVNPSMVIFYLPRSHRKKQYLRV